jgi:hypothetical protein
MKLLRRGNLGHLNVIKEIRTPKMHFCAVHWETDIGQTRSSISVKASACFQIAQESRILFSKKTGKGKLSSLEV